jgi:hypothetical protein
MRSAFAARSLVFVDGSAAARYAARKKSTAAITVFRDMVFASEGKLGADIAGGNEDSAIQQRGSAKRVSLVAIAFKLVAPCNGD